MQCGALESKGDINEKNDKIQIKSVGELIIL